MKIPRGLQAHRGFERPPFQDNSIEAIESAAKNGFAICEIDVHLSKDGVPVVTHDPQLPRAQGGYEVAGLSASELGRLGISTLKQVIDCKRPEYLNIELKPIEGQEVELARIAAEVCQGSGLYFSSFHPKILQSLPVGKPKALIVGEETFGQYDSWDISCDFLHLEDGLVDDQKLSNLKKPVVIWTVNNPSRIHQLAEAGVYGVITDKVSPKSFPQKLWKT